MDHDLKIRKIYNMLTRIRISVRGRVALPWEKGLSVEYVVTSRIMWAALLLDGWTRDSQHTRGS